MAWYITSISIQKANIRVIDINDNWPTEGHTDSYLSNILARYITSIPRPKGITSDIDSIEKWHTKGHTNGLYPRS